MGLSAPQLVLTSGVTPAQVAGPEENNLEVGGKQLSLALTCAKPCSAAPLPSSPGWRVGPGDTPWLGTAELQM